jgi:integrase
MKISSAGRLVSVRKWNGHPRYDYVCHFRQGGKRHTRYFVTRKDACLFAGEKRVELLNEGRKHGELTERERRAVIAARELEESLATVGIGSFTLEDAVEHYAAYLKSLKRSASVQRAAEELIEIREAEGKSPVHIADLKHRLLRFARANKGRLAASITTGEVASWLLGLKCGPQSRVNYRRAIHNLFAFCVGRGYAASNPVAGAVRIKVPAKPIGILTVTQARNLLLACASSSSGGLAILPAVALGLFAGLRREEIARLDWREIDLARGFIEVAASKTKSAQRRLVTISPNLAEWLKPCLQLAGAVRPKSITYRRKFAAALKAARIEHWPHNALRHSFASYHLALHKDAAKLALELGHHTSATLFRHYREIVRSAEANAFWAIFPNSKAPQTPDLNCLLVSDPRQSLAA